MAGARDREVPLGVVRAANRRARKNYDLAHYAGSIGLAGIVVAALSVGTVTHFNDQHRWAFALAVAALFVVRGVHLGRPITGKHLAAGAATIVVAMAVEFIGYNGVSLVLLAASGLVLMWPTSSAAQTESWRRVYRLVERTAEDPLAPFAMHTLKSYFFADDHMAVISYHTRFGVAVVSGDPIGDPARFRALAAQFQQFCRERGWRIVVLAASERCVGLWSEASIRPPLRAVPIGRDVVIDVGTFDTSGRQFRNLRQAVNRTRNAGLTTEVVPERELSDRIRTELLQIMAQTHGSRTERGFSMILDHPLDGCYPGVLIVLARDAEGVVQGFQRYAVAGYGTEITLDVPWRREDAPNGVDERLSVAMVDYAREHGRKRVSLAFAAFPELFDEENRRWLHRIFFSVIHLGDPLLSLESLYRYLEKYHALGERRFVLLNFRMLPIAAFVLLTLEFVPRRRSRRQIG